MARRDLARRHEQFEQVSPQVGELDRRALERALRDNPSAALEMVADLTVATDERLRVQARRLARTIVLDRARTGRSRAPGSARLRAVPADRGGDLDIDASIDSIAGARAVGRTPGLDELVARDWGRPDLAVCLVVDASGSMSGARLAAAALTAAACAWRAPREFAVISFAREVSTQRPLTAPLAAGVVVERLLQLRGHGVTALAGALRAAGEQLAPARAQRRLTILLSDCRATDDEDPVPPASALDELVVLAPAEDSAEAAAFAARSGARWEAMADAADAPDALSRLLDG
ncbi:MAG TPA: VWA domain-containing protein [Jatrophihabitans sp.]